MPRGYRQANWETENNLLESAHIPNRIHRTRPRRSAPRATGKKNSRSVLMWAFASERCGALTELKFILLYSVSKIGIVVTAVATNDRISQPYARMFCGEFTNDRQPEKFLLIGLNHQEDPDSEAGYRENQHQRQSN